VANRMLYQGWFKTSYAPRHPFLRGDRMTNE
jgi:hypothetical protein